MYCYAISLLVWTLFHPSSMSFLCRAQTTMSCYVTNFESLLLKEFPSNDMTKPLNAIIGVANFSVNFPLQRKESQLIIYRNSRSKRIFDNISLEGFHIISITRKGDGAFSVLLSDR